MGGQYWVRVVKIKISSESQAGRNVTLTCYLGRNQQPLDLYHFIIVLGDPGSLGLSNGLGKFCNWFVEPVLENTSLYFFLSIFH